MREDKLALDVLVAETAAVLGSRPGNVETPRSKYIRAFLAAAIARGATQYVLLGAGLDTHAYRNQLVPAALRVFEVDHSITQSRTPAAALSGAGFERTAITFFSWQGVTPCLTPEATLATLAFMASMPPGSAVVFDYAVQRSSIDPLERTALDGLASRVARAGEPLQLFLDPRALRAMLGAAGFRHVEDLGPAEIHDRYFRECADGLKVKAGLAHLVHAQV